MIKQSFIALIAILLTFGTITSSAPSNASPHDFLDEALQQLENLRATVTGNIQATWMEFSIIYTSILNYGDISYRAGGISIDQYQQQVLEEITQLKELAEAEGTDASACVNGLDEEIQTHSNTQKSKILACDNEGYLEADRIVDESYYLVDITLMKVNQYEFQLQLCGNSVLCLSPVVEEIEKDIVEIPLAIRIEVSRAKDLVDELQVIMDQCADIYVAEFTEIADSLVDEVESCVGEILGQ